MATANKIATKTYCNTIKANSFSSDLTHCVTASVASNAGFNHNSTPAKKCVKETNISERTVTFSAIDLTPYMRSGNYIAQEVDGNGWGMDRLRKYMLGSIVMLDHETNKLKLFAFSSLCDVNYVDHTYKEYDCNRFTPLGVVVGVPATEYYYRKNGIPLYSSAHDSAGEGYPDGMAADSGIASLTVMSLVNYAGTYGFKNHRANAANFSSFMRVYRNSQVNVSVVNLGLEPVSIYNPIELCGNLFNVQFNSFLGNTFHSIFPIYYTNAGNCAVNTPYFLQSSFGCQKLNFNSTAQTNMTCLTGLRYPAPMATSTYSPVPTTVTTSAVFRISGIGRVLTFDSAHYSSDCASTTSYEVYDTGVVRDFMLNSGSGYSDKNDGTPFSALQTKTALVSNTFAQRLLRSPYSSDKDFILDAFQDANNSGRTNSNTGLFFTSDDFLSYNMHIYNVINNIDQSLVDDYESRTSTYVLPSGVSYESALLYLDYKYLNNKISYWKQTSLYNLVSDYTNNYGIVYTPSLYELFKLVARCRHIFANVYAMNQYFDSNSSTLTGLDVNSSYGSGIAGGACLASCELEDNIVWPNTNLSLRTKINTDLAAGNLSIFSTQTGVQAVTAARIENGRAGRMCVSLPSFVTPTSKIDSGNTVVVGPMMFSGPILWNNAGFNSVTMYNCPMLVPFIRIPVDHIVGTEVNTIWNCDNVV